jgi:hypothetical protein
MHGSVLSVSKRLEDFERQMNSFQATKCSGEKSAFGDEAQLLLFTVLLKCISLRADQQEETNEDQTNSLYESQIPSQWASLSDYLQDAKLCENVLYNFFCDLQGGLFVDSQSTG